ncbi:MAG TPA: hypothetical protein VFC44_06855 [Candidatus Saccharimonadales bacterium]|nr:hypothetical protein [Candidatus Saccharimonadales bacterium]
MSKTARKEIVEALRERYGQASKLEKSLILGEFTAVFGYHRKHAIRLLSSLLKVPVKTMVAGRRVYDEAVKAALVILWEAADRICGKRLKAAIPDLIRAMEKHWHLQLDPAVRKLVLAVTHCPDSFFNRHLRVHSVLVIKVNHVNPETLQARIAALTNIFRLAIDPNELALFISDISKLGGQNYSVSVTFNCITKKSFVVPATIHIGCVEKVDSQVERPMNRRDGFFIVARPVEFRHSHAAQADG